MKMKVLWLLTVLALSVSALPIEEAETRINGENGWYVPQVDGSFVWMEKAEVEAEINNLENMEDRAYSNKVQFYLYTKSNPKTPVEITADKKSINASPFNAKHPTRFTIHGWTSSYKDGMNVQISNAWLEHGEYNTIAVDWDRARSVEYLTSVMGVPKAGEEVANMIDFLVKNYGMSLDTLDVIGHSLGAHVAGFTGKNVKSGQIHTIIGLDPALPLYSFDQPKKRLASTDAFYVESIQTNGGQLGFLKPIGKGAFYPNGGKVQPGCAVTDSGCSHGRSVSYYVEAVKKDDFPTMKCANYEDAVAKSCGSTYSSVRMGAVTNAYMVAGDYYVPVNSKSPFGMGAK